MNNKRSEGNVTRKFFNLLLEKMLHGLIAFPFCIVNSVCFVGFVFGDGLLTLPLVLVGCGLGLLLFIVACVCESLKKM